MAASLARPGVEIIQEFRSTSPTIVTPTLVPCNVAPFFEVLQVLNTDGTVNANAKLTAPYAQLGMVVPPSSFPAPRGNINELVIQDDTVRWFFNFGGTLEELSRTSGFLAQMNVATQPFVVGTAVGPFNLTGKSLVVAINAHNAVGGTTLPTTGNFPVSANVTIPFTGAAMSIGDVVAAVNAMIPGLASDDGSGHLQLTSSKFGASASVCVRAASSAASTLGFSVVKDQVAVGAGFYASNTGNGTNTSPRIDYFKGSLQRDIDAVNSDAHTAVDFTAFSIKPGDQLTFDGVNVGEVLQVFQTRLIIETEENIFGVNGLVPFAPRYAWVQAENLVFPAPSASTSGSLTGTASTEPANVAYIVAQAAGTYAVGPGESFNVDISIGGVAQPTEVIGSGAGWANQAAAIAGINGAAVNFEAYPANDVGDQVTAGISTRIAFRTKATNTGSSAAITLSSQTAGMTLGFSALPVADIGEDIRYLAGTRPHAVEAGTWTGGAGATATEFISYVPTVNGVVKSAETITWASSHANTAPGLAAAILDWNNQALYTQAYESNASGVPTVGGNHFAIRTRGENFGTGASINVTATDSNSTVPTGTVTGVASALSGDDFQWSLDLNPKVYDVVFTADQDDGSTSLAEVISKINAVTPGVASASTAVPPQLKLTSQAVGGASQVLIGSGTANTILGFTAAQTGSGSGRPAPDLALDINGNVIIQNQILRDGLTGTPFANGGAPMYAAYKALRLDVSPDAINPGLLRIDSTATLQSVANPISTDNPGALMCFLTLLNSPGTSVAAIGVPEVSAQAPDGTPLGYARCAEFLESEEVYAIALGTHQDVVHQAFLTHVTFMSQPEQKGERILFFNPTTPTRKVPTLVGSGTNANTTATPGKVSVENNLAAPLIAMSLDPTNLNPTTGAIVNPIYLQIAGDDHFYLIQKILNGTDVYLRDAFVSGDGNEDAFYATSFPVGVISQSWSVSIRGAKLTLPGSTLPDKDGIAETVQAQGQAIKNRRGYYVLPDQCGINVTGLEQLVEGWYSTACIVGMVGNLPPQQGFTNFPIGGLTRVVGSNDKFSNSQLSVMAAGGIYILIQDTQGAPVISRHQLSTDLTSIETRELSITKVVDFTAKFIRAGLRNFIGRSNITQAFLDQLGTVIHGMMSFLVEAGVLIGADVNNIVQSADEPDTVLVDVTIDVPFPCNFIRVTLVI